MEATGDDPISSDPGSVDCFVPLERVGLPLLSPESPIKPSTVPPAPSSFDCKEACAAAVLGRKPATLQSAYMSAVRKRKVTRAAHGT
eukprot:3285797-Pleurochrysis_carterae.AAC.1